ncbi:MAG: hypothetical protein OCC45_08565 [Desulfotalea sp.]
MSKRQKKLAKVKDTSRSVTLFSATELNIVIPPCETFDLFSDSHNIIETTLEEVPKYYRLNKQLEESRYETPGYDIYQESEVTASRNAHTSTRLVYTILTLRKPIFCQTALAEIALRSNNNMRVTLNTKKVHSPHFSNDPVQIEFAAKSEEPSKVKIDLVVAAIISIGRDIFSKGEVTLAVRNKAIDGDDVKFLLSFLVQEKALTKLPMVAQRGRPAEKYSIIRDNSSYFPSGTKE